MDEIAFASTPIYILSDNQFLFLCIALQAVGECVGAWKLGRMAFVARTDFP